MIINMLMAFINIHSLTSRSVCVYVCVCTVLMQKFEIGGDSGY